MKKRAKLRFLPPTLVCMIALFGLAGCASTVPLQAAPNANDPACANVIVRLPSEISGLEKRSTDAQSTGAWGTPDAILLRCGIQPTGPTTETCVSVNGGGR